MGEVVEIVGEVVCEVDTDLYVGLVASGFSLLNSGNTTQSMGYWIVGAMHIRG